MSICLRLATCDGRFSIEKHFSADLTIGSLCTRLSTLTGVECTAEMLEHYDENDAPLQSELHPSSTLAAAGIYSMHTLKIAGSLGDLFPSAENVAFRLSEESYDKKEGTFRRFKEANPHLFQRRKSVPADRGLAVGDRCFVNRAAEPKQMHGRVVWRGRLEAASTAEYLGVDLDQPVGVHDGAINGTRYFTTKPNHAAIARISAVFPEDEL